MTDTAKRLAGPLALTASAVTRYTVPAATTTIVRSIHVASNDNGTVGLLTMSIGADATGTRLFYAYPVPANGVLDWSGFLVLNAGDILQAYSTMAVLILTVSGVEVT